MCLVSSVILLLLSCTSLETLAPPVDLASIELGAERGHDRTQLEQGRLLYLTACTRCHTPVAITNYSLEEWRGILPPMLEKAGLGMAEGAALEAYIEVALRRRAPLISWSQP